MQEENVTPEATQEPVEAPQEQVAEEQVEQEVQPTETNNEQETPSEEQSEEAPLQEEPEINYDLTQFLQPQQEQPIFVPDEDGYIDPNKFYQQVKADAVNELRQEMKFQESERKAWAAIEKKYPEVKEDPELRDILNAQRIADVASGGKGDLNQVASKLLGKINSYKTIGKAQAQVSEKVQKSASLQQNTATNVASNKDNERFDRMSNGDISAADELIAEWLESGKL